MYIHPVFVQAFYYGIVMLLTLFFVDFLQNGFFWKFFRVKLSFGRLILVKVRGITRDHFSVGQVHENFLVFKLYKDKRRIAIRDNKKKEEDKNLKKIEIDNREVFYRSLGCLWVDYDEQKNALSKTDYRPVEGFDSAKYESLYIRTLYKPTIADDKTKIMFGLLILVLVACIILGFLIFKNSQGLEMIWDKISSMQQASQVILGSSSI